MKNEKKWARIRDILMNRITSTILKKLTKTRDMEIQTEILQQSITIEYLPYGSDMPYRGFISEDPIGFDGGGVNLYAYAKNNPVLLVDPNGQCPWCAGAVVGGISGAIGGFSSGLISGGGGKKT